MNRLPIVITIWVLVFLLQDSKPPAREYKLTEVQLLKLQVVQKDAFLLKAQIQDLQRQFGEKIGDLQRTAEKIKLENNWPPDTAFDMDLLTFSAPKEKTDGSKNPSNKPNQP